MRFDILNTDTHVMHRCYAIAQSRDGGLIEASPRETPMGDGDPTGVRTRVTAVKGRCPRPLDDRVSQWALNIKETRFSVT